MHALPHGAYCDVMANSESDSQFAYWPIKGNSQLLTFLRLTRVSLTENTITGVCQIILNYLSVVSGINK